MPDLAISGPVGFRRFVLEKVCESGVNHKHNYDHTTFVHRGKVRISIVDDNEVVLASREYEAGSFVHVPANQRHIVKALEPNTVYFCVFSHRDFDGLVTQEYHGNDRAYD